MKITDKALTAFDFAPMIVDDVNKIEDCCCLDDVEQT